MGLDLKKLKAAREAAGISQRVAAARAQMKSAQAWQRIESGVHVNISLDTLDRMAKALNVNSKYLLK